MIFPLGILLLSIALATPTSATDYDEEWEKFLKDYNPDYANSQEREYRKQVFISNLKEIEKHNAEYAAGKQTSTQGVNQFTDKTKEELRELSRGFKGWNTRYSDRLNGNKRGIIHRNSDRV